MIELQYDNQTDCIRNRDFGHYLYIFALCQQVTFLWLLEVFRFRVIISINSI